MYATCVRYWNLIVVALVCFIAVKVDAIGVIDNALVGNPLVQCGPDKVEVSAKTERPFEGVVYIKDWRRADGCFAVGINGSSTHQQPRLSVPLSELSRCGMEMKRKPETGEVIIRGVWVFSFHPMFVTKVDRAYSVHCIFRQKEFTVTSRFSINDLITKGVISRTATMPNVGMKIVSGLSTPDQLQPAVTTVKVGDPVLFVWYLPETSGMFGLKVRDCTAENKRGSRVRILEDGCTSDEVAISNVAYNKELNRAFATAHAFKFADNEDMWFKCTVAVCVKIHNSSMGSSEDSCEQVKICNGPKRHKREWNPRQNELETSFDDELLEQRLSVLDAYNLNQTAHPPNSSVPYKRVTLYSKQQPQVKKARKNSPWVVCLRKSVFALVSSIVLLMYTTTFILGTVAMIIYLRRKYGENALTECNQTEPF